MLMVAFTLIEYQWGSRSILKLSLVGIKRILSVFTASLKRPYVPIILCPYWKYATLCSWLKKRWYQAKLGVSYQRENALHWTVRCQLNNFKSEKLRQSSAIQGRVFPFYGLWNIDYFRFENIVKALGRRRIYIRSQKQHNFLYFPDMFRRYMCFTCRLRLAGP